jgi:hypothetical protein
MNRRTRSILTVAAVLAVLVALAGLGIVENSQMTEEKLSAYSDATDLAHLSGLERANALHKLEQMVNALSLEERRKWWLSGHWRKWFDAMTENEKKQYVDATLPVGFKQVLNSFETLPDGQRKRAIDDTLRALKDKHMLVTDHEPGHAEGMYGTNASPVLSAELENRARMLGFKTFYAESTAETKAELAPFVEELQHQLANKPSLQ